MGSADQRAGEKSLPPKSNCLFSSMFQFTLLSNLQFNYCPCTFLNGTTFHISHIEHFSNYFSLYN